MTRHYGAEATNALLPGKASKHQVTSNQVWTPVCMEPTLKYHPLMFDVLTWTRNPGCGQCLVGSLTGAVSS